MHKKQILFVLLIGLGSGTSYAQSINPFVIASAGGHGNSTTQQLSWTIGEPIIATQTSTSNILTQGFHQTNLVVNSIFQLSESVKIQAFPNPTTQSITIALPNNKEKEDLSIQLLDLTGKQLKQQTLLANDSQSHLNLENYPSGIYLISIQNSKNQVITTHQIIKK